MLLTACHINSNLTHQCVTSLSVSEISALLLLIYILLIYLYSLGPCHIATIYNGKIVKKKHRSHSVVWIWLKLRKIKDVSKITYKWCKDKKDEQK